METTFRAKRIYEEPSSEDGLRILVDRLWPRGVSKANAHIDLWAKELTPSSELRKWFHENPDQFHEFSTRYLSEIEDRIDKIQPLMESLDSSILTLVTATKDLKHGHVSVLKKFLEDRFNSR